MVVIILVVFVEFKSQNSFIQFSVFLLARHRSVVHQEDYVMVH